MANVSVPNRSAKAVAAFGLVAVLLGGCGGPVRAGPAADAARSFTAALAAGDGAAACALLTDRARSGVESFGRSCAQAILALPAAGPAVGQAQVWGDSAQVRFEHDVLFLSSFDDVWKVRAAGCQPGPDEPYTCVVRG